MIEKKEKYNIAVIGATGVVGSEILKILVEREFPYHKIYALASKQSAGTEISLDDKNAIKSLDYETKKKKKNDIDIAFLCAGDKFSAENAEKIAKHCVVIDKSTAFRNDKDVPLIVPEVNPEHLKQYTKKNIIASPNCTTIPLALCLKPLDDKYKIKRVVVSTYQSVSGAGKKAMDELYNQSKGFFEAKVQNLEFDTLEREVFPKQIAFNCIPQIDVFTQNGYTKEEDKMVNETAKIFDRKIPMVATCVRVPVFRCHAEVVNLEFENDCDIDELIEILSDSPAVVVLNRHRDGGYATQFESVQTDCVFVSRIRKDFTLKSGVSFWLVCDNLRKGAALNGVQIAELLIGKKAENE